MTHLSVYERNLVFFIVFISLNIILSLPIYDGTQPLEIYFSTNSILPKQYAISITAQSLFQDNFFKFVSSAPSSYPDFLNIIDLTPVTKDITLQYENQNLLPISPSTPSDPTCVSQTTLDCTIDPVTQPLCSILKPTPALDSIQIIDLQDLNCAVVTGNTLCDLRLSGVSLLDTGGALVFQSQDNICTGRLISITIKVSAHKAYLPPSNIVGSGTLTFYFHKLTQTTSNSWMVTGSLTRITEPSEVTTEIILEPITEPIYPQDRDLNTIIKTQLLKHDNPNNIYCRYRITYTGFIRGIFVNSYPSSIHSPRGIGLDIESTVESTIRLPLRANEYNLISIFGYRINKTELEFFDCKEDWTNGTTISVHFSTYAYDTQILPAQDYTIQANNFTCPSNCTRCTGDNLCISCYYLKLARGQCASSCPSDLPSSYGYICHGGQESGVLLFKPFQLEPAGATIWLYNELATFSPVAVTIHATENVSIDQVIRLSGTQLLAESIITYVPELNFGVTAISIITNDLVPSLDPTILKVFYNMFEDSIGDFDGYYWDIQLDSSSGTEQFYFRNGFNLGNKRYKYLEPNGLYIVEGFVNCNGSCEVQVSSDGVVQLYKNYRTLLFDLTFVSRWTYSYQNISGFVHLRFVIRNANFFRPSVIGQEITVYTTGDQFFTHNINIGSGSAVSVANCRNNKQDTCFSCEQGFLLSTNQLQCGNTCDSSSYSQSIQGVCKSNCNSKERISTDGTKCEPVCDQLGYFYTKENGCSLCVPECAVCSSANTCMQCRFNDASNSDTFCWRKNSAIFISPDFNIDQDIAMVKEPGDEMAIVVAGKSSFSDLTFFFSNTSSGKVPRIFKVIQMEEVFGSPNMAQATIPPLSIADSGAITFHYLKIQEDTSAENYSITAFRADTYMDWPLDNGKVHKVDSTVGPLNYNETDAIELYSYQYETIIASRLYKHDQTSPLKCRLKTVYSGWLRGAYANGELILSDSINSETTRVEVLSKSFDIPSGELMMLTFVGFRFWIQNTTLINCSMETSPGNSIEVSPTFTSYTFLGSDAFPDTFNVVNNTYCGPNCLKCINNTYCLRCEFNFLQVNGQCQTSCPNPKDYQVYPGFCENKTRNQGYRMYSYYDYYDITLSMAYNFPLGVDMEVLVVVHPFVPKLSPHGAYVFIPDNEPVLAEGAYLIANISKEKTTLFLDIPVKSEAVTWGDYFKVILYTIKRDLMLFVCYTEFPETLNQLKSPESYQLITYSNSKITLLSDKVYFLDFFLNCTGQCQISFRLEGNIHITLNERTYLFEGYIEPFVGTVQLHKKLSGLNHLLIKVWNTTEFTLNIEGSYIILTQGQIILNNILNDIPTVQCTQTHCENCYIDRCISCKEGYMLDQATGNCARQCPAGTKGDLFQRICAPITCSFSTNVVLVAQEDYCVWNCVNSPRFYYNISRGCKQGCAQSCDLCSGPLENHCLSCNYPRTFDINHICVCPVGTQGNSTGDCESISYINLIASAFDPCTGSVIEAQIRPEELQEYNISFFWELASSNSSSSSHAKLISYLTTQTSRIITIPQSLLEIRKAYTFTGYYYNVLNQKISNSVFVETHIDIPSELTLDLGSIRSYITNNLKVELGTYSCAFNQYDTTWSVVSGPISISMLYFSSQYPLQFTIPACSLPPNTHSTLKVRVQSKQDPTLFTDVTVNISTMHEAFNVFVRTNSRDHPETIDLNLKGEIDYYDPCALRELGQIQYSWSCNRVNSLSGSGSCPDTSGLFGVMRNTDSLTYPKNYFSNGDVLALTLFVTKNGVTKNNTIDINIRAYTAFIVNVVLDTNRTKYVASKDYLVYALVSAASASGTKTDLTTANYYGLTFQWNTYPAVPFVAFQDKMKILANNVQFPLNVTFLQIELSVSNSTHSGASYLSLPINRPPSGGSLSVAPATGISLSTNFTISLTNWQDEDVPITYQFEYSLLQDDDFTPLVFAPTPSSNITTFLPAQHSGGPIYIKVSIKDYFGAETSTNTQVYVHPVSLTLTQSLKRFQTILDSAEKSDSSLIMMAGIISKEISEWESELTKNLANACPVCSNHGICLAGSTKCECENGWGLADCSLGTDVIEQIIELKERYLTVLNKTYGSIQGNVSLLANYPDDNADNTLEQVLYQTLQEAAENEHFNSNTSLTLIQNILEQTLKILDPETVLTVPDQVVTISEILSSMLSYASAYDCGGTTDFTKDLANKTLQYLQKVSQSSLSSKLSQENATVIDTQNIDMYFQRLSICDLQNKIIPGGNGSPEVTINLKSGVTTNCSLQIDLKYIVLNDGLLNCNEGSNENKTNNLVSIEFSDPQTGSEVNLNVSITISSTDNCPSVCTVLTDHSCTCDDLSPFDLKSQIIKIFEVSNLANQFKIEALLQFEFWKAVSFWGIALFTLWFLGTFYIVRFKIPTYNSLDYLKAQHLASKLKMFWTAVLVTHPMLSVYCVYQKSFPKATRATLYFSRNIFLLALTSAFSESSSDTEFEFRLFDFNPYLLVLPYFTVIPVYGFLAWLMENHPIKFQSSFFPFVLQEYRKGEVKGEPSWNIIWIKHKVHLGYTLTFSFLVLSFLVILIINANLNDVQRLMWTVDFINSLAQDFFVTPILFLAIQYALFKFYSHKYYEKRPKIRRMVSRLLDHHLRELREVTTHLASGVEQKDKKSLYVQPNGSASNKDKVSRDSPIVSPQTKSLDELVNLEFSPHRTKPETKIAEIENQLTWRISANMMDSHDDPEHFPIKTLKTNPRLSEVKLWKNIEEESNDKGSKEEKRAFIYSVNTSRDPKITVDLSENNHRENQSKWFGSPESNSMMESPLDSPQLMNSPDTSRVSIINVVLESSDRRKRQYQRMVSTVSSKQHLYSDGRNSLAFSEINDGLDKSKQHEDEDSPLAKGLKYKNKRYLSVRGPVKDTDQGPRLSTFSNCNESPEDSRRNFEEDIKQEREKMKEEPLFQVQKPLVNSTEEKDSALTVVGLQLHHTQDGSERTVCRKRNLKVAPQISETSPRDVGN